MSSTDEKSVARQSGPTCHYYTDALQESAAFRKEYGERRDVVKASEMPMERSPDGLIKHIVNERMNTKECCVDIYMQFIEGGKASGKHRHLSEEIFYVVEGRGYDLHWDVKFDCKDEFVWEWEETPKRFDWQQGDFVYVPPYCTHQHFNADPENEARIIVVNSRIIKDIGFNWFEQLEHAEGF